MKPSLAPRGINAELPIGIFDSGVGGLTVVRAIRRELPHEDIVQAFVTAETERFTNLAVHFLGEPIESALQVDLPPL